MIKEKDDALINNCIICGQTSRRPPRFPVICPMCGKVVRPELCPKCGAHLMNWKETFGEDHTCPGEL